MRPVPVVLGLVLLVPIALASETYEHHYVMFGSGCGGGGALIRNCESYFPFIGATRVDAEVQDVSGQTVRVRLCHEWTYHNGSHPTVWCNAGCSPAASDALRFPPWSDTTYRVILDLRGGPGSCQSEATAGTMRVTIT